MIDNPNAFVDRRLSRQRWGYTAAIPDFLCDESQNIIGALTNRSSFAVDTTQRLAWQRQIKLLKAIFADKNSSTNGALFFEFDIPRLGSRIDAVLLLEQAVFVPEFKVGSAMFSRDAVDQVWDYALDLKNFHEPSHELPIVPILIATDAADIPRTIEGTVHHDRLTVPLCCGEQGLEQAILLGCKHFAAHSIDYQNWRDGRYHPTPTIVEAARALYAGHNVKDISRSDAGARNLDDTANHLSSLIKQTRERGEKAIFFVTGIPGAGKTLVGLDIASRHTNQNDGLYSVYLSGNDPLVKVLHEALARDQVRRVEERGDKLRIGEARSTVKQFIQNVHHFRDDCLATDVPPIEHIALFDEAQRAWSLKQTTNFMRQKKGISDFSQSEPGFLISCLDRHNDWAAVVCLVGNGQEINTGEAGIREWLLALQEGFESWLVYASPRLPEIENQVGHELGKMETHLQVHWEESLHLATSIRSFRSEHVSDLVNQLLNLELEQARITLSDVLAAFPIRVTRCLKKAKRWLQRQARGNERYGIVVSSQAQRLKPHAIDVRVKVDPVRWFLEGKDDVRSSFYLEDAATEFQVQGLELDWTCVVWDGDLRLNNGAWDYFSFKGKRWQRVRQSIRQRYLLNAYRVLLTRARQGMVIVVPEGSDEDHTRQHEYYDPAYDLLEGIGIPTL